MLWRSAKFSASRVSHYRSQGRDVESKRNNQCSCLERICYSDIWQHYTHCGSSYTALWGAICWFIAALLYSRAGSATFFQLNSKREGVRREGRKEGGGRKERQGGEREGKGIEREGGGREERKEKGDEEEKQKKQPLSP